MYELPLFPLNTVLFPGMPLSLHVFEERYKAMIGHCVPHREPFGVVLIRHGLEVGAQAEPYSVGCTAHITHLQALEEGRFNLIAVGRDRFRIHELRSDRPYLVGVVENLPAPDPHLSAMPAADRKLRPLVSRYLDMLADASNSELDLGQLPEDPVELGYLAASVLQLPAKEKQPLLDMDDGLALMKTLARLYRREMALLPLLLRSPEVDEPGPFSLN